MTDVYAPCLCGSGNKFKFCCYQAVKKGNMQSLISGITKFPIHTCRVLNDWEEEGISPVYVVRKLTNASYVFASYMVDFWCLGVKDVAFKVGINDALLEGIFDRGHSMKSIPYQEARSMILGAVDYARSVGMPLSPTLESIHLSFIEADQPYERKVTFGKDGVPFYMPGPYDHENYDVKEVLKKVQEVKGEYIVNIGGF